jgi:xanthine/CO dehydrogenase XdhC/CoxF family maturation factor
MTEPHRRSRSAQRTWIIAGVLAVAFASPRAASQQVLALPDRTVEFIGLRSWTMAMVQDSLAVYAPGDSIHTHTCAAALRYRLGFAEAASVVYLDGGRPYVLVSVVEPQDSARVRHRDLPRDTTSFREPWSEAVAVIRMRPDLFQIAVDGYAPDFAVRGLQPPPHLGQDSAQVLRVWGFLATRRSQADYQAAAAVLTGSAPSLYDRMVAAAILANFADRDSTWWVLVDALRESDGPVKAIAGTVLAASASREPRAVHWRPAAPTIHALLNGTGLFEFRRVLEWLPRMGAGPEYSREFLAGGGEMVLAYLAAEHGPSRDLAHRFLVAMRGEDCGDGADCWRDWISSLEPTAREPSLPQTASNRR